MRKLEDKVAIVTGASKGIGASIAKHLAAEGAGVVVNYASSREDADRVVAEIARAGGRAIAIQADLGKPADVDRLFAETAKAFGRLDILVNNAGIYEFRALEDITPEHFHKHFDVNVLGVLLAARAAVKHFGPAGGSEPHKASGAGRHDINHQQQDDAVDRTGEPGRYALGDVRHEQHEDPAEQASGDRTDAPHHQPDQQGDGQQKCEAVGSDELDGDCAERSGHPGVQGADTKG